MFLVGHCQQNKNLRFSKMLQGTLTSLYTDDLLKQPRNTKHEILHVCSHEIFFVSPFHLSLIVQQHAVCKSQGFFLTFSTCFPFIFRLETGAPARIKPFGVEVRNVRCLRCGNYGHQSGDRECPLKDVIMPNEESRLKRDDPLTTIMAQTDSSEVRYFISL